MDINALIIFHKVAETNSFSVASRVLEIPISTISRKINKLEDDLKRKLFFRSTRKVNLTPEGQLLYNSSKNLFNEIHDLENVFYDESDISGEIRITCTIEHKNFLVPYLIEFRKQYPHINFFLNFSNDVKDMIENSFDFAFRAGNLKSSNVYAHKLYNDSINAYIHKNFYQPHLNLEQLKEFEYCIMANFSMIKPLVGDSFKPSQKIVSNSVEFILNYAKQQPSIVYLPQTHVSEEFIQLKEFESYDTSFHLVYLHKKLNKPCSVFLNFFKSKDLSKFKIFQ